MLVGITSKQKLYVHYLYVFTTALSQANLPLTTGTGLMHYHDRLCVEASHILLLILRKSLIILIAHFSPRLPTLVIVYTIYFLLKPLHTVLTVLGK